MTSTITREPEQFYVSVKYDTSQNSFAQLRLKLAYSPRLTSGNEKLELDLQGINNVNIGELDQLVAFKIISNQKAIPLAFINISEPLRRQIEAAGLMDFFV